MLCMAFFMLCKSQSATRRLGVRAVSIKHDNTNARAMLALLARCHSARAVADSSTVAVGVSAFAVGFGMCLVSARRLAKTDEQTDFERLVRQTKVNNATFPGTRGSLAFKGRTHWPALNRGLEIFEDKSGQSSEALLSRIISHASLPTDLPVLAIAQDGHGASVEIEAGTVRNVLCHAMLCNGYDAVGAGIHGNLSSKHHSRCASDDFTRGGGLVFDEWLSAPGSLAAEKAACMMFYLDVATRPGFDEARKIRYSLQNTPEPFQGPLNWPNVSIHTGSMWHHEEDTAFVNFGNAHFLFGKVAPSNGGVSVEEFLQMEFPELVVGMLYFDYLRDNEAVIVDGIHKYSNHKGYMKNFACDGACTDKRIFKVVTMDAKNYNSELLRSPDDPEFSEHVSYAQQFTCPHVMRDIAKARAAFQGLHHVSTGMWGCGQFKGNVYLKFLEQLVAASQAGVGELSFSAFGAPKVAENCEWLLAELNRFKRTPEQVLAFLRHDTSGIDSDDAFLNRLRKQLLAQAQAQVGGA